MQTKLLFVGAVIFVLIFDIRPVVAKTLFNIANVEANKVVFGEGDAGMMLSLRAHTLAQTWMPDARRADPIVLAGLRASDSCARWRVNDTSEGTGGSQQAWLAWRGKCLWLKGDRESALYAWGQYPVEPFFLRLARFEQGRGNPASAFEIYAIILDLDPNSAQAWLGIGQLHERAERWEQAEQAYEMAIRVAPDSALAYQTIANYRWIKGMKDARTEPLLLRAIQLSTTSNECMVGPLQKTDSTMPYLQSGRLTLVQEEQSLIALKCLRNLPWIYSELAHWYLATNCVALAEQAAREVIRLDPNIHFGYLFLGEALFLQGKLEESVLAYEQALAAGGGNMEIYVGLAQANLRLGRYTEARKYVLQLISTCPKVTDFRLVSSYPLDIDFRSLLDEVGQGCSSESGK